jgi:hypothetical protein
MSGMNGLPDATLPAPIPPLLLDLARALKSAGRTLRSWWADGSETGLQPAARGSEIAASQEYDLEVYGLTAERLQVLGRFGSVNLVGESFAVYRVSPLLPPGDGPLTLDVSLPRRDSKVAPGHRASP